MYDGRSLETDEGYSSRFGILRHNRATGHFGHNNTQTHLLERLQKISQMTRQANF